MDIESMKAKAELWDRYQKSIEKLKSSRNKSVKKTLTIPQWLNDLAEDQNINFSQLLQDALKEKLGIYS